MTVRLEMTGSQDIQRFQRDVRRTLVLGSIDSDYRAPIVDQARWLTRLMAHGLWLSITLTRVYENYGVINDWQLKLSRNFMACAAPPCLYRREISRGE